MIASLFSLCYTTDMEVEQLGPYKIGRILGRGGMGAVYEGLHEDGATVAIKVLPDPLEEDAEIRVRFETEIETLKRLHHPNIVRLSGFGAEQGQLYYVMEFVNGPSLQQELRKKRLFQWYEVAKIGVEICQALRHAHDRGVIHRDIKPANILLDREGNVKLSDFGIARFFGSQQITDMHSVIGTLEYMSPEQAFASPISSSTDLYSLGCVLFVLLTGKPPFPARSLPELLRKHKMTVPAPLRSVRQDVPDELEYIIVDMLQLRPENRPRNAFLLAKRLQSLLQALVGDPAEVKVLPMSLDTPKQHYESLPSSSGNGFPSESVAPHADENNGSSVVPFGGIVKPVSANRDIQLPQGESLSGSFKRIGEEQVVTVFFPENDSDKSASSPTANPLTETVTSWSASLPESLRLDEIPLSTTRTLRPTKDDPMPDAAYRSQPHVPSSVTPPLFTQTSLEAGQEDEAVSSGTTRKTQSTQARFTAVATRVSDPFEESHAPRPLLSLPMVLTSTLLMLIGLTVYYLIQPVPPDVLYTRITSALRESETAEGYSRSQLMSAQKDIQVFLESYSDHPSAEQIRAYQDELDLLDHERRLERRMQFSALRLLSPVERTYANILTSSQNDPEQMIGKLRAFIAVFQTVRPEESVPSRRLASGPVEICVELAQRRLKKLEFDAAEINAEQQQAIRMRLDKAVEWNSTDPMRAEGIRRGIIELYQHNRWAKELVEEAEKLLEK